MFKELQGVGYSEFKVRFVDAVASGDLDRAFPAWRKDKTLVEMCRNEFVLASSWAALKFGHFDGVVSVKEVAEALDADNYARLFDTRSVWDEIERLSLTLPKELRSKLAKLSPSAFALAYTTFKCSESQYEKTGLPPKELTLKFNRIEKLMRKYCGDLLWFCFSNSEEVCGFRISYEEYFKRECAELGADKAKKHETRIAIRYAILKEIEDGKLPPEGSSAEATVYDIGWLIMKHCGADVLIRLWEDVQLFAGKIAEEKTNEKP